MLTLARYVGEEIVIGNPSNPLGTIMVVSIKGNKVKLGFDFPIDVSIFRKELGDKEREYKPSSIRDTGQRDTEQINPDNSINPRLRSYQPIGGMYLL